MNDTLKVKNYDDQYVDIPIKELVRFIFDTNLDKHDFKFNIIDKYNISITDLFRKCCINNLFHDAYMIYDLYSISINNYIKSNDNYFFEVICGHYHDNIGRGDNFEPEMLEWLINKVDMKKYKSFLLASVNSTKTVKFLYRHGANIFFDEDTLFIKACQIQNINLMYWLHERGAEPRAKDDEAFRTACTLNHIETAMVLCHMYDKYSLKVRNGKIVYWKIENDKTERPTERPTKRRKLM